MGLSGVMVQAACNSLLSSGSTIQVGSYFTASLNGNAISIGTLGSFTLNGVLHVDVRASGGNLAQVILTVGGTPPQGGTVTVNVPLGLDISDGIPYINILGSIGTNPNFSDINADYVVKHSSLVDADIILIRQLQPAW